MLGPNMPKALPAPKHKLTRRQLAFVEHLLADPGNRAEAARKAGVPHHRAAQEAWRLWQDERVREYFQSCLLLKLGLNAGVAANVMGNLLYSKSDYVKLEAAKDALDRAGFKPADRRDVRITGDVSISIDLG